MKPTLGTLAAMVVLMVGLSRAQNAEVTRYDFSPGAFVTRGGNAVVMGVVGQSFAGGTHFENTMLESGFLVDTLFRPLVVGVENQPGVPLSFALDQNYPNPFNPSTTIRFALPVRSRVSVKLYNLLGQDVMTLVDEERAPGFHQVVLSARALASGVYIYRMVAEGVVMTRKLVVLR